MGRLPENIGSDLAWWDQTDGAFLGVSTKNYRTPTEQEVRGLRDRVIKDAGLSGRFEWQPLPYEGTYNVVLGVDGDARVFTDPLRRMVSKWADKRPIEGDQRWILQHFGRDVAVVDTADPDHPHMALQFSGNQLTDGRSVNAVFELLNQSVAA